MKVVFLSAFAVLFSTRTAILALPDGANSCKTGRPAVGGPHTRTEPGNNGELTDGSLVISVDGYPLDPTMPMTLTTDVEYSLSLTDPADSIRGFLFILENGDVDTSRFLTPGDIGEPKRTAVDICPETTGVMTHSNNNPKSEATGVLKIEMAGTYDLYVTVVVRMCSPSSPLFPPPNDMVVACDTATSIFFYSAYKLNVELPEFEKNPSLAPTTNTSGGSVLKSASSITITCIVLTIFGMFCASIVV
eukprot:scaffold16581_cov63-Attheya_sp.AAC.3